ncbi:MAG TPA: roadblock/LC7 domain-containing protein [bacterium]|jgi:predicted regulator of Ras-like GTPase activity (Roadblock/LC7/MglB family)|nr:roadblock/LC7 domain-containing protein [bacterium]
MDFKAALQEMVSNVDGSIGAGLVGLDGLVIDQVSVRSDFDITVAGAEYATIIKNALKASQNFGLGRTSEIMISTEKATMIMMTVGQDYFATLALGLDGNLGRGRLELKKQLSKFEQGLA